MENSMKKIAISCLFLIIGLVAIGCDRNKLSEYDDGYEAAWDEANAPTRWSSKEYKDGYEQGLQDAAMYDEGYYDGYNKNKCAYPNDPDYMDGYKDGKKRR